MANKEIVAVVVVVVVVVVLPGGMWPRRLNKKCGQIVEDMGEDELYQAYYSMKDKPSGINPLLFCKTILPDCKTKATQKKKSSKQEL